MRILITAIGSFSADCVIKNLKTEGHYIVGTDINPPEWIPASELCDKTIKVPLATTEKEYIKKLIEICKNEDINYLLPLTDIEIDKLNLYRNSFNEIKVKLFIQDKNCLNIARDKYLLYKKFYKNKFFSLPHTILGNEDFSNFVYPLIAKPRNGRSSEGIIYFHNNSMIKTLENKENYIIQNVIQGSIYTVDYVRDKFGNDFSIAREELLRTKNGAGTTIRIVPNSKLQSAASFIGNELGVIGCINIEFIFAKSTFYLIDINPRFSAGIAFSDKIGYNLVKSNLNCFTGKQILPSIILKETLIAKRYVEYKLKP